MSKKPEKIIITSEPQFVLEQSDPIKGKFVWSYEVTIVNNSSETIQLLNRYWRITDTTGHANEIRGAGVVGLQPLIRPSKSFTYTSYCQLSTPEGIMEGHYEMQNINEQHFKVDIPKFGLAAPISLKDMHTTKYH